ncbi:hypothetical protein [Gimesia aquarii]|uniref:Uncharacterized protein n=1 Tax=Gimesia aquarii TaxID=2527964 RepID=A0A517WPE9_9PLAN|nr:hypothetical protein [Gimesia aquarii]QDU07135.1 hypothetical protein V202x_04850 [Gimesia aquarii]
MKSALYVTTKDFCKRARFGALLAVGTLVSGPLLFLIITRLQGLNFDYRKQDMFAYHFAYLGVSWIIFLAVCLHALTGCQKICLGLPVPSKVIATWLMLATVVLVIVLQLVTNGAYRVLFFDENWLADYWPLLGPLLFITTLILVGHYIFWSLYAPSFTRVAFWITLIVVMFWWFISRYYPNGYQAKIVPWSHVTLWEFITLQLVSVAAWYQGTRAFAKVRSGIAVPSPQWQQMQVWWNALLTGAIPESTPIPLSKRTSLARLHWRDSCHRAVIIGGTLFMISVLAVNLTSRAEFGTSLSRQVEGFVIVTMVFSFIAAVIVALLIGEGVSASGRTEMKRFLAMSPLSDNDFNATLFWNMIKACVLTLLLIQGGLILSYAGVMFLEGPEIFNGDLNWNAFAGLWVKYTIYTVIGFWIIVANMISILWTGRTWFYYTMIGVFFGGFSLFMGLASVSNRFFRTNVIYSYIFAGVLLTLPFLIVGGTIAAYVVAYQKKRIRASTAVIASLLWLVSSILTCYFKHPNLSRIDDIIGIFFIPALLVLIIAPFATIPLALSWNRHR